MNPAKIPPQSGFLFDDSATCEKCSRFGALQVNDQWVCEECYALSGSCCPEFTDAPRTDCKRSVGTGADE